MNRRIFLSMIILTAIAPLLGAGLTVHAHDVRAHGRVRWVRRRRRVRRRIRVRRHIRRRAFTRVVFGRPFWVVPVALAVGWELAHANRVVVVKEIKIVERDARRVEVAVVQDGSGKTEQIEITREDTKDNAESLPGSVIANDDKTTPGIEREEEVEVEE